jgi:hypothetical protein
MSQRALASDQFVPFLPATAKPSSQPVSLTVVPNVNEPAPFSPLQMPGSSHPHSPTAAEQNPVVTLQREGERITGIRIECGCGQVIELACSY